MEATPTVQQSAATPAVQTLRAPQGIVVLVVLGGGGDGPAFLLRILLPLYGGARIRQETWPDLHISSYPLTGNERERGITKVRKRRKCKFK